MRYQPKDKRNLMKAALGQINSNTVITNVKVVNVIITARERDILAVSIEA